MGHPTGSPKLHMAMTAKRRNKLRKLAEEIPVPEVYGDQEGDTLLVGWGSTYGPIHDAVKMAREHGEKIGAIHLRHVHPLPNGLEKIFAKFKRIVTVEMNDQGLYGFGQLATILRARYCEPKIQSVTKTDGLTFRVKEIFVSRQLFPGEFVSATGWIVTRTVPFPETANKMTILARRESDIISGPRKMIGLTDMTSKDHYERNNAQLHRQASPRTEIPPREKLTKKAITADHPTWCPGCGDFAVLAAFYKVLEKRQLDHEKIVTLAGIGCSSRFPYFVNGHGAHYIHGRAVPLASGISLARPDLHVFLFGGDGDGFSIGGNHVDHGARKNINMTYFIMDNFVYGLTKKQTSPTSPIGFKSKTDPTGAIDQPVNPMKKLIAGGATFIARTHATQVKSHDGHDRARFRSPGLLRYRMFERMRRIFSRTCSIQPIRRKAAASK